MMALDLWADGGLTGAVFWKLARKARPLSEVYRQWQEDPAVGPQRAPQLAQQLVGLGEQIHHDVPILPGSISSRASRLTFLRSCEALLRVGENPVLLSTPAYQDGTLDFDDVLARLKAGGPVVGPLDLVQALYRLRPTDPARAAELNLPPVPVVAQMCRPEGQDGWNAVDLVRAWVAAGGLPPLDPRPSADGQAWTFLADAPVPWSMCSAAPTGMLNDDIVQDSDLGAVARVFPLWPDRLLRTPFPELIWQETSFAEGLSRLGGQFALASHDYFLAAVSQNDQDRRKESVEVLVELVNHDRLDPHLAAEAALGRRAAATLALSTSVQSWEDVFRGGGLRGMWPIVLQIASALCGTSPKPSGLPALLRLLSAFAPEVPDPVVPDGIRRLAGSPGSSRTQVEARTLVNTIDSIASG
jgi:hypothetical protein